MSISYCSMCERVVEGNTHTEGGVANVCDFCGEIAEELPEDDPKEDR